MATRKKKPAKASSAQPKKRKAKAPGETTQALDEIVLARRAMDEAHAEVVKAGNALRRASANQGDFAARERNMAEAEELLAQARTRASEATKRYSLLKLGR